MEYSVFDTHCDTLCIMADEKKDFLKNDCETDALRMSKYKSYTQVMACFTSPVYRKNPAKRTKKLIDTYLKIKDLPQNVKTVLSLESCDGVKNTEDLRYYYKCGVRMAALTWNKSNHLAAGADEKNKEKGLTGFGREIVCEMNRLKMFLDVSHLNDKSFFDVAEVSEYPLIASHSCSRTVCNHRRNLTDEMFEIIVKSGGCVGINLYPIFLNNSKYAVIDDVIRHIEHFMSLGGESAIGIGSDFDGTDGCLPQGINGCEDLYKIFDRLLQMGYSEETVNRISYRNFSELFEKVDINC